LGAAFSCGDAAGAAGAASTGLSSTATPRPSIGAASTGAWPVVSAAASSAAVSTAGVSARSTNAPKRFRIASATSSSIELEWVFFSVTPNSGKMARMTAFGCSHSRASSFMRIFLI
jgi:hypothetical protein